MIIQRDRSLIPACDVGLSDFERIVRETADLPQVGAYKIGFQLGLSVGLPAVVKTARRFTDKPLIYDHQKSGTDIPDTGRAFVRVLKESGIQAAIFFPLSGPVTQRHWIEAARDADMPVIIGAIMTHDKFLHQQGGYIADDAVERIFALAIEMQVNDFVVPGNQVNAIARLKTQLAGAGVSSATFYAPGFVAQGGTISEAAQAAGGRWHAIVGRALYGAKDLRAEVLNLSSAL